MKFFESQSGYGTPRNYENLREQYVTQAHLLYTRLILPVANQLTDDVIVIPDEHLCFVPFELLLTAKPERLEKFGEYPYLLKDRAIGYAFNLHVLREQMEEVAMRLPEKEVLAMAPYAVGDSDGNTDSSSYKATPSSDPLLVGSEKEVRTIAQDWNGRAIVGPQATKQKFCQLAPDYSILHLATHAKSDKLFGEKSHLLFAPAHASDTSNRLYADELLRLDINSDLVVLSACETADGEYMQGEGVISMARAFTLAGAKRTVTTLWPVKDEPAQRIMINFHRAVEQGYPISHALRKAKLDYLSTATAMASDSTDSKGHPFFWGGFISIGSGRAIK